MRIDIMTLFPDTVGDVLSESILGRAQERGILRIETHQIRDYTANRQNQVDDYPYGGGHGAVLQADPLYRCWCHVCDEAGAPVHTIYLSPAGHVFDQSDARRLAKMDNLVFVCGHYEGIDQRFIDECVDEELSIGDFVVTGGEIPAMAITDAVCRLVPGVLSDAACFEDESHWAGTIGIPAVQPPRRVARPARAGYPALRRPRQGRTLAQEAVHPPHAGAPSRPVCRPAARQQGGQKNSEGDRR